MMVSQMKLTEVGELQSLTITNTIDPSINLKLHFHIWNHNLEILKYLIEKKNCQAYISKGNNSILKKTNKKKREHIARNAKALFSKKPSVKLDHRQA